MDLTWWIGFLGFVALMLALDLGVFHRTARAVAPREALGWSAVWIVAALGFAGLLGATRGAAPATEFLTGYLIEKALAVDNVFVFVAIFGALAIPSALQHRVLFWGVLGALALRAGFIAVGALVVERFHWSLYLFGAFLVVTGWKLFQARAEPTDVTESALLRLTRRLVPVTDGLRGDRFIVVEQGVRRATPLLLALILVELVDVVFAVDSIPAIFAVTRDPFIVFTSNIFAILGLRSMYFLLAELVHRFVHLKAGLALVLVFVGTKMLAMDVVKLPIWGSPLVIAVLVGGAVGLSLRATRAGSASGAPLR